MAGAPPDGFFPGRAPIDAYGAGGFRFADMSHRGSILALPSGIRAWSVASLAELTPQSLAPVFAEAGLKVLLIGTGAHPAPLPEALRWPLKEAGLVVEVMATGPAVRTYNIMVAEDRPVGAALIAVV